MSEEDKECPYIISNMNKEMKLKISTKKRWAYLFQIKRTWMKK